MSVIYKPLDREDWDGLHSLAMSVHLDGECYLFAIALHRALGWPLIGLMSSDVIRHALLKCGDEVYFDVRGNVLYTGIGEPFDMVPPYDLREIQEKDLAQMRPFTDFNLETVIWMAQALWPELPWKSGPLVEAKAFLEELDTLCKKHRKWIRAPLPTTLPIICESHGDETYSFTPSVNGRDYFFDRVI